MASHGQHWQVVAPNSAVRQMESVYASSLAPARAVATDFHHVLLQMVSVLALAVSRALNVWPNAALVNYGRPPDLRIPQAQQFMMWFSGMRGAMAFAMVLRALEDLPGEPRCTLSYDARHGTQLSCQPEQWPPRGLLRSSSGISGSFEPAEAVAHVLLVVTFFLILLTVLVNGGAAATMMRRLKLRDEDDVRCWSAFTRHAVDHRPGSGSLQSKRSAQRSVSHAQDHGCSAAAWGARR